MREYEPTMAAQRDAIVVPNLLGRAEMVEAFVSTVRPRLITTNAPLVLNFRHISWISPFGALQLLRICEEAVAASGSPVQIMEIEAGVHAYLRRIDFFVTTAANLFTSDSFDEVGEFARSAASLSVIELTRIAGADDIIAVVNRTRRILRHSLDRSANDIDRIVSLLTEACDNIVLHSGTSGWLIVQKYDRTAAGVVDVELAIADGGIGIRESLAAVHGQVAGNESGFILRALEGLSARGLRERGQGLAAMRRIVTASGGHLAIRSGGGSVGAFGSHISRKDQLASLPGTQIGMSFRSPLEG